MPPIIRARIISRSIVISITRVVPRFPKNATTLVGCLNAGVGCPAVSRRVNSTKEIVIRFIISGSKSVSGPRIMQKMSTCLSGRTVHIVDSVPG